MYKPLSSLFQNISTYKGGSFTLDMYLSSYLLYQSRDKYGNSESPAGSIDIQFYKEPLGWHEGMRPQAHLPAEHLAVGVFSAALFETETEPPETTRGLLICITGAWLGLGWLQPTVVHKVVVHKWN